MVSKEDATVNALSSDLITEQIEMERVVSRLENTRLEIKEELAKLAYVKSEIEAYKVSAAELAQKEV